MEFLKKLFQFYINSSIHVALAVVALTLLTMLEEGLEINPELLGFVFFGTITGYNFVKYAGIAKLHHLSLAKHLRIIQIFSFICFLALIYFTIHQKPEVLLATAVLGVFTLLYALPVFKGGRNLRDLTGIKIFIIAFVWAGVTVVLPLVQTSGWEMLNLVFSFLQRFLFVVALILSFEIRDLKFDHPGLGTLPQSLGVEKTKYLGFFLLLIMIILELLKVNFYPENFLALIFAVFLTALFLYKSRREQRIYFASFWVEAVPLFWLGSWLFFNAVL